MSESGQIWTWGKGDYYRLGHSSDQHVRRPQLVEGLRGLKIVDVAVGALHCLAVTDTGKVGKPFFQRLNVGNYEGCTPEVGALKRVWVEKKGNISYIIFPRRLKHWVN